MKIPRIVLISDVISRRLGMPLLGQGSRRDRKKGAGEAPISLGCAGDTEWSLCRVVLALVDSSVIAALAFGIILLETGARGVCHR